MKRIFEIEFPNDLGKSWMNVDNLIACLFSKQYIGGDLSKKIVITDITDPNNLIKRS